MKKSILIFLFVSSITSTFKYAYDRTGGNLVMSTTFTMHCLLVKAGLVEPFIVDKYEPPQLDQSPQVVERLLPYYMAEEGFYERPPRVYMGKNENKVSTISPHYSHSIRTVTEIRAGMSSHDLREAAKLLVTVWIAMSLQNAGGFSLPPTLLKNHPHLQAAQPANNLLFGKPKVDKFSSKRFNTQLAGRRRQRVESSINMNEEYQQFVLKNPNVKCLQNRFEELCREKKKSMIDRKSIDEALSILEAERQGLVINPTRPEPNAVDADFEIQGPGRYDVADVKTPINWGKGNEDLDAAAQRMGKKIQEQRYRMRSLGKTPLHIVDLRKLSLNQRMNYQQNIINTIGHSDDIVFLNGEAKI